MHSNIPRHTHVKILRYENTCTYTPYIHVDNKINKIIIVLWVSGHFPLDISPLDIYPPVLFPPGHFPPCDFIIFIIIIFFNVVVVFTMYKISLVINYVYQINVQQCRYFLSVTYNQISIF